MAKVKCDICGCIHDEYWMIRINPGTGNKWLCWECYKNGHREAAMSEMYRQKKLYKIKKAKERSK